LGNAVGIEHRVDTPHPCPQAVEFTLASLIVVATQIGAAPVRALRVEFAHPAPADDTLYRTVFGVVPRFDAPLSRLVLDADVLQRPVPAADPELSRIVTAHADHLLASIAPTAPSWRTRVHGELVHALPEGRATLQQVARALGMSGRSQQRRLGEEGVGFGELLDDVRHALALHPMANDRLAQGKSPLCWAFPSRARFTARSSAGPG